MQCWQAEACGYALSSPIKPRGAAAAGLAVAGAASLQLVAAGLDVVMPAAAASV